MLQRIVASKLTLEWVARTNRGWLKRAFPDQGMMRVSHETIYRSLFIQAQATQERIDGTPPISAQDAADTGREHGGPAASIRDRPTDVEDRAIPGHWEGDLMAGSKNTHIATLVERQSRFTMLVKMPGKDTASVVTR